jgi:hypothetical protein
MRMIKFVDLCRGRETVYVNPLRIAWIEEDPTGGGVALSVEGRVIVTPLALGEVLEALEGVPSAEGTGSPAFRAAAIREWRRAYDR